MKVTGERFIPERMQKQSEIEHMHRYNMLESVVTGKVVLDAACGTGYGSNIIAQSAERVYGLDISEEALSYATEHYCRENLFYVQGSIDKLPFEENAFDVLISFETIEHVNAEMQMMFLKEIKRVLKPDGILIMSTPNKKVYTDEANLQLSEWHVKEFYENEFHEFIESEFCYAKYYDQFITQTSYLMEDRKKEFKAYNYPNEKKGKFIVAVASNKELDNSINLNSIYYYPEAYIKVNDYIQVYYGNDLCEITEESCVNVEYCNQDREIKKRIEMDDVFAKYIRIDPSEYHCTIKIHKVEVTIKGKGVQEVPFYTNAEQITNNIYTFYTNDPQIIVELSEPSTVEFVEVAFDILSVDEDLYPIWKREKENNEFWKKKALNLEENEKKLKNIIALLNKETEYMQIFYSNVLSCMNEENSFTIKYDTKEKEIKKRIEMNDLQAKFIRLDPAEHNCMILINKIGIKLKDLEEQEAAYKTNAEEIENNIYTFYHNDPQIIIELMDVSIVEYLDVDFSILSLNIDLYPKWKSMKDSMEEWKKTALALGANCDSE